MGNLLTTNHKSNLQLRGSRICVIVGFLHGPTRFSRAVVFSRCRSLCRYPKMRKMDSPRSQSERFLRRRMRNRHWGIHLFGIASSNIITIAIRFPGTKVQAEQYGGYMTLRNMFNFPCWFYKASIITGNMCIFPGGPTQIEDSRRKSDVSRFQACRGRPGGRPCRP